jgi:superfamily II DNA or RNA helicase
MTNASSVVFTPGRDTEAFEALVHLAGRRTLPIPAEILAEHTMALPGGWDWPVRRAAFEAILRRLSSARGQELTVAKSPRRGPFGDYSLRSQQTGAALRYDVRLYSVAPLQGRCDCPDFVRGALGLCKHLLAVVDQLAAKSRLWKEATDGPTAQLPRLRWDTTLAPASAFDPLSALGLEPDGTSERVRPPAGLLRLFRSAKSGPWRLEETHEEDPEARLRLVADLQKQQRLAGHDGDPAVRAVLADERNRLERILRLRAHRQRLRGASSHGKRRLYDYQKAGVERFLAQGRLVLADDMGLGKTTQAIVAAAALQEVGLVRRGLFIVPASLKSQWQREWQAVSSAPLVVVEGGPEARREIYTRTRRGFLVTNYEQVVRDLDAIASWGADLVVLDEAQRIKNWSTRTALTIKHLRPTYRLVLTGTPMENRLEELASIVEWVDDRALEPKWRLLPLHSAYADGTREVTGARNLAALRARLAPVLLRRLRSEVLAQLPPRQDTVVPVALTEEQRSAHDDLNLPIAKLLAMGKRRPLSPPEFLRLMSLLATQRVIANGMAQLNFKETWPELRLRAPTPKLLESLATPKLNELRELVGNLVVTQKRKLVVFSQWRRMLELAAWAVSDLIAPEGLRAMFFTGQEGLRRRTQNLVDFHDDPKAAILFLSDAGGVGLNLQKAANACINLELPWNPAVLEQRIGRIHRLGQKRPIDVYNLVSQECIEERIAGIVSDKRALFKGVFEGSSDQIAFERSSSFMTLLERLIEPPSVPAPVAADPAAEAAAADEAEGSAIEVEEMVDAANAPGQDAPAPSPETPLAASLAMGGDAPIARLFQAIRVERGSDGSLRIEAPPAAAGALASLFDGMARLLTAVAAPAPTKPEQHPPSLPS